MSNNDETDSVEEVEYKGLGGWLILLGIGLVTNPIKLISSTYSLFNDLFVEGTYNLLTSPSNPHYDILLKPTIIFECMSNIILIILSIINLVLFFKKSKYFPKVWIVNFIVFLIIQAIDIVLCKQLSLISSQQLNNMYGQLFKTIIPLAIWGTYLKKSKRVKNTFVE